MVCLVINSTGLLPKREQYTSLSIETPLRWLWTIPETCRIAFISYSGFSAIFMVMNLCIGVTGIYKVPLSALLYSAHCLAVSFLFVQFIFLPVPAHPLLQILNSLLSVLTASFFSRTIYFHLCLLRYRLLPLRLPLSRMNSPFYPVWPSVLCWPDATVA